MNHRTSTVAIGQADAFGEASRNYYHRVIDTPVAVEVASHPSGGRWLPSNAHLNAAFCPELVCISRVIHLSGLRLRLRINAGLLAKQPEGKMRDCRSLPGKAKAGLPSFRFRWPVGEKRMQGTWSTRRNASGTSCTWRARAAAVRLGFDVMLLLLAGDRIYL